MLEMIHHLLPTSSSSIFTSIIILVLATVHIPTSFSQDDQRFVACGEPFRCGTVRDITYPFWGENRRAYCGHPGFPLTCQSGVPLLTIQSLLYRILSINPSSQVLTVARDDLWSTDCPESLHNTTLDFSLFNYAFGVENITLHYDCPVPGSALIPNQFDCNNNESSRTNIFARTDTPTIGNFNVLLCQDQIIVPVNSTSAQAIGSLSASVSDLRAGITAGFGLQWIVHNTACNNCIQSGGRCGYNSTTSSFACFCSDQPYAQTCNDINRSRTMKFVFVGLGGGFGGLFMIMGAWWLRKIIKRRKKAKLKMKFFERNGGLLLQKQMCSAEQVYVEKTKLFSSKELETATDHYNEDRVLGRGGQGTVYKGILTDGKIVAVKKSKIVDEGKLDEFINEVVILSQINHRNVVKLHGCCLETEVPLLVYDFIPNGTLFQYIHHQENEDFPLTWDVRLRIASEVAGALFYLHSAASLPIYHRDIKSSNILLDDEYRAKVADFGTSRLAAVDQTHMTTRVQGTFGYLDPEYYQSSQFTAKSDVYSFGVVLVELLTGQKAVLPITFMEGRSLATYFILSMKKNRLFDTVDAQVLKEGRKGEIVGVANLAYRCLNLNGRKRPTMKEVAMELEAIKTTHAGSAHFQVDEHNEEVDDYGIIQLADPFNSTASSSITSLVGR